MNPRKQTSFCYNNNNSVFAVMRGLVMQLCVCVCESAMGSTSLLAHTHAGQQRAILCCKGLGDVNLHTMLIG